MKHAILETGSRTFIALEKGFHGKTLGAVQLTANQDYREPFEIEGLTVHRVRGERHRAPRADVRAHRQPRRD